MTNELLSNIFMRNKQLSVNYSGEIMSIGTIKRFNFFVKTKRNVFSSLKRVKNVSHTGTGRLISVSKKLQHGEGFAIIRPYQPIRLDIELITVAIEHLTV
ncbi:MAG: hypothetical protein GX585_05845 [Clostridiales bacterium]|mgnify:CR=1 FL=1|nr:hypothetical protein [Clostridiales bacterium]